MKKYLLLLIAMLCSITGYAGKDVSLYISQELKGKPGEVITLPVAMSNNFDIVGFQFWLSMWRNVSMKMVKMSMMLI